MRTMPYNFAYNSKTSLSPGLSSAISYNKGLQKLYDNTSIGLSTGKSVNSSYDNSTLYFKDMRLTERAAGLNSVLDSVGMIVTTLTSSDQSIKSLTELVQLAKSVASYAADSVNKSAEIQSEFGFEDKQVITDISGINDEDLIVFRTGDAHKMEGSVPVEKTMRLNELGIAVGDSFNIKVGDGEWVSLEVKTDDMRLDAFLGQLTTLVGEDKLQYEIKDGQLTFISPDRSPILVGDQHYLPGTTTIDDTNTTPNVASKLGLDLGHTIEITAGETIEDLLKDISSIDGIKADLNAKGKIVITSTLGDDLVIGDLRGKTAEFTGIQGGAENGLNARQRYAEEYNEILKQIDDLVKDSTFNGLNLLQGDNIRVVFNEEGTSVRTISGVKLDTASLGLAEAVGDWQDSADIAESLKQITDAITRVRGATNKLQQDLYMVQSRESFLTEMANTYLTGAETMTAANLEEVSAQLLAIKTQQDLAAEVISLTLQSNAQILSMF